MAWAGGPLAGPPKSGLRRIWKRKKLNHKGSKEENGREEDPQISQLED